METIDTLARHLEDVMVFRSVAELGSFTQAADRIHASKAQLSKQVVRLEAALGVQLLERTTRSVRVTSAGQVLLKYADRIAGSTAEAGERIAELKKGEAGKVKITAPVSVGRWCFPSMAGMLRKEFPKLIFDANLSNEPIDFREDEIDFAIRAMEVEDESLIARYLGKLRDVIVCTPALAKKYNLKHPSELEKVPCILNSLEHDWNAWTLISAKEEVRVEVKGTLSANEYSVEIDFVLAGLGIARLPYHVVETSLKSGELVQLFPKYDIGTHPLYLVYRKGTYVTKHHRALRDWIIRWFEEHPQVFVK
jgi:DNA-binding transcriptional LysR family regulator